MSSGFPYFHSSDARERAFVRGHSMWAIVLGVLLIVAGILALSFPVIATINLALFFGVMLLIGGFLQIVAAFGTRVWGGFFLYLLLGLLYLFVGAVFIERPLTSAIEWTLIMAIFFVAGGLVRIVSSLTHRYTGWGWGLLNGVVTLVLGVLIWRQWPSSGLWVIGTFLGIELLFNGWTLVMLGLAVRNMTRPPAV